MCYSYFIIDFVLIIEIKKPIESEWVKWNTSEYMGPFYKNSKIRTSGSVCGVDPR